MKKKSLLITFLFIAFSITGYAQDDYDEHEEETMDTSRFSFGVNIGAHFGNNNTASIYSGSPSITPFGVEYIFFQQPFSQQEILNYFQTTYQTSTINENIEEYPINPTYRTASEIGVHFNYRFDSLMIHSIFLDVNIAQLRFEQLFTVGFDDPRNQSFDPTTFIQFPIFGEENRYHINLGVQLSMYHDESSNAYFSAFGNVNRTEMRRNYIVVGDREYDIFHRNVDRPDQRLGGWGYGGGVGLGFKYQLGEQFLTDFYYNLYYNQINLKEDLQPFGTHHAIGIRIIWGKN